MVIIDGVNFRGDSLHGHARKTLQQGRFLGENDLFSNCDKKCDKVVLHARPRNWRDRLSPKCSSFRIFCSKTVVGQPSRDFRDPTYAGPFRKRCFAVFFGCCCHRIDSDIFNGFRTVISQKGAQKCETVANIFTAFFI